MDAQRRRSNSSVSTRTTTVHSPSFPIKLFCKSILIVFTFFCILFWSVFIFKLPAASENLINVHLNPKRIHKHFFNPQNPNAIKNRAAWGFFGEMMVRMLPDDLPFTVFVPSEQNFRRILGQKDDFAWEGNFTEEMAVNSTYNNTFAVVTRILGFSTVPLHLLSRSVPLNAEVVVDSLSGFELQVTRSSRGVLYVNNVSCEATDARRGQIIVHVARGVIMDAEFEQSMRPEEEDFD